MGGCQIEPERIDDDAFVSGVKDDPRLVGLVQTSFNETHVIG